LSAQPQFVFPCFSHLLKDFIVAEYVSPMYLAFLTRHIGRAALILLCLVTELQMYLRFEGADIDSRIVGIWDKLMGLFEAKELYDERYATLMKRQGDRAVYHIPAART
jgi:hypothetical protein